MKRILIPLCILLILAGGWLLIPSARYVPRALRYLQPGIEDHTLFYNRIVVAGSPREWEISPDYHTSPVPMTLEQSVEELGTVAFVVIRDNELLFERYWDHYGETSYSNSFSMAKSIVSLLTGIALSEGKLSSLDEAVSVYIPDIDKRGEKPLTIRDLLTMSAGIQWDEAYNGLFAPNTKAYYGKNLAALMHAVKVITTPGVKVNYQSGVTQLLAMVLEKATGENISDYASRRLWTPMHAEQDALWSLDHKDGMEKAYCCFNSNARDFARFGQLILNHGRWDGISLVDSAYLATATAPASELQSQYDDQPNRQYGYQFWILEYQGMQIPYMRGILGQYVFALPELNAVVVRLGHKRSEERTAQHYPADIDVWLSAAIEILGRSEAED